MVITSNIFALRRDATPDPVPRTDMHVMTAGGTRIPVHSNVIASASRVLENAVYGSGNFYRSERVIRMLGVPCEAVVAFLQFLYLPSSDRSSMSSKEAKDAMERYGLHLMALSHKYGVEWLKQRCEAEVAEHLRANSVVDALHVAKLCNAPRLYQRCMSLLSKDFASVQRSEAWRFVQRSDPRMELEILHFLQDSDQRKKRWWRQRADQETYRQLGEAMECLEHICPEGCTVVGPHDRDPPSRNVAPCTRSRTCEGLQHLIRHLATCSKRLSPDGGCPHCKRMWQLFRLHSYVCDRSDPCSVPFCKQFKERTKLERKVDDSTWKLLAKKVTVAGVMSSLARRERPAEVHLQKQLQRFRGNR